MKSILTIKCPICDQVCGKDYPPSPQTFDSGGSPGYREGIGENFAKDGVWYCCQACKDEATEPLLQAQIIITRRIRTGDSNHAKFEFDEECRSGVIAESRFLQDLIDILVRRYRVHFDH